MDILVFSTSDPEAFRYHSSLFYKWKKKHAKVSIVTTVSRVKRWKQLNYSVVCISHNQSAKFQVENIMDSESNTESIESGFQIELFLTRKKVNL